jgi:hypothetical protein
MKFNFEVLAIFGIGHVVGLSIGSGLVLAEIRRYFVHGYPVWRDVAWTAFACANVLFCSISTVTAMAMFVIGDGGWDREDFWPRAVIYATGISLGAGFVAFAVRLLRQLDVKRR